MQNFFKLPGFNASIAMVFQKTLNDKENCNYHGNSGGVYSSHMYRSWNIRYGKHLWVEITAFMHSSNSWQTGSHSVSTPESISQVVLDNNNWNFIQTLKNIRYDVIRNMTSPAPSYTLLRNFQIHRLRYCTTRIVTTVTLSSTCETQTPMKCH